MCIKLTFNIRFIRVLFLIFFSIRAYAVDSLACETDKFYAYADVKASYQIELVKLIESINPSVMFAAKYYMTDQLLRIDRKRSAFDYLKSDNPLAINFNKDLNRWIDLSQPEQAQMSRVNAHYAELTDKINARKKTSLGKSGRLLRKTMRQKIMPGKGFQEITHILSSEIDRLNDINCQR
jgi:hypothetical protein